MIWQDERLARVIAEIDAVNARDPRMIDIGGRQEPAELLYGKRITATLQRMVAEPSAHLRIAIRGQHIERWTIPRSSYAAGRAGYLSWRRHQRDHQARRLGEIMAEAGYEPDAIARVGTLIRKENMKRDAEVQTFEDIICVTFLEHYLPDFSAKTDEDKLAGILAKTWRRMSPHGHDHASRLDLQPEVHRLLQRGLRELETKGEGT
jgi:hypothetical protein